MVRSLPPSGAGLDTGALAQLFRRTTNSYKYLFFLAILTQLKSKQFRARILDLDELTVEMTGLAWYPYEHFRLSFGIQDKIADSLREYPVAEGSMPGRAIVRQKLRAQGPRMALDRLMRYVPYRLLTPFFEDELTGLSDSRKNRKISLLADRNFDSRKPLYRLRKAGQLEVHPDWLSYLYKNFSLVEGWANWAWVRYLTDRNPNVPNIANKVGSPAQRNNLNSARKLWEAALERDTVRCPYSGYRLTGTHFELDHFIPWRYVAHDHLWNLVAVIPEANQAKRDRIPAQLYVDGLIDSQFRLLKATKETMENESSWESRIAVHYLNGLRVTTSEELLNEVTLADAYEATVGPMMAIAKQMGFSGGWHF
ncbi:HNH endonuclease domain-containing protein [Spectribacter hydrogenooxidans]|uniref:HNH endonuclease domain-containing protein n=1 Tax=Spectribacter hydrogenoxidans TaxID=3075608 RepID=A0ABU3C030_9GAMM|nr:HNH endonuclease domain-containing protein [Salinisphaera sp. W335]MDT0634883.1 HNH endonuclease domain-containing protein [Salinisphaera sp. W335]